MGKILVMERSSIFILIVLVIPISFILISNISAFLGYVKASFIVKYIDMVNLGFICF